MLIARCNADNFTRLSGLQRKRARKEGLSPFYQQKNVKRSITNCKKERKREKESPLCLLAYGEYY